MNDMLTPIEGKAAWRGDDLLHSPAWRRVLTAAELAALERATAAARGVRCPGFGKAEFPVPELAALFAWMAEQLERASASILARRSTRPPPARCWAR